MRNIFDQYSQPENRLTHALVCVLSEDQKLLKSFVHWVTSESLPKRKIQVLEQRLPGEAEASEDEAERRGLPDAWFHDYDRWSLLIECKVAAPLNNNQLLRHKQTAIRRGFDNIKILVIDVSESARKLPDGVIFKTWSEVYEWLQKATKYSDWAQKTLRYMEIAEAKWAAVGYLKEGTLTKFSSIPFDSDNPYNYPEAKRLVRLMMDQLRKRNDLKIQLNMDPVAPGRGMITGKASTSVWDFLRLKAFKHEQQFTRMAHLTVSIQSERLIAMVTIPNGIKNIYRKRLVDGGFHEFEAMFKQIHANLNKSIGKVKGAQSYIEVLQRHYLSQSAPAIKDAIINFNLDTAFTSRGSSVKHQPLWLRSTYDLLADKKGNTQLGVGVIFPYSSCPATQTPEIIDHIASGWISSKPLIKRIITG